MNKTNQEIIEELMTQLRREFECKNCGGMLDACSSCKE